MFYPYFTKKFIAKIQEFEVKDLYIGDLYICIAFFVRQSIQVSTLQDSSNVKSANLLIKKTLVFALLTEIIALHMQITIL